MVYTQFGSDPQKYIDYINSFGLSQPLGFQMMGEGTPKIKNPSDKSWSGITLPWMSIGYEVELTPLQILAFYNAVANDGKLIRPIIVKSSQAGRQTCEVLRNTGVSKERFAPQKHLKRGKEPCWKASSKTALPVTFEMIIIKLPGKPELHKRS
jgi:cell division protein FtsI (penicillin-binding protein 3)